MSVLGVFHLLCLFLFNTFSNELFQIITDILTDYKFFVLLYVTENNDKPRSNLLYLTLHFILFHYIISYCHIWLNPIIPNKLCKEGRVELAMIFPISSIPNWVLCEWHHYLLLSLSGSVGLSKPAKCSRKGFDLVVNIGNCRVLGMV